MGSTITDRIVIAFSTLGNSATAGILNGLYDNGVINVVLKTGKIFSIDD